jgi:hypothetical protein
MRRFLLQQDTIIDPTDHELEALETHGIQVHAVSHPKRHRRRQKFAADFETPWSLYGPKLFLTYQSFWPQLFWPLFFFRVLPPPQTPSDTQKITHPEDSVHVFVPMLTSPYGR